MAGAQPGVHSLQLESIRVPESLKRGNKFLKWDEDGTAFSPVTMMVDSHGYFLHWMDQSKETDCLEITSIRDTRNGKYAKTPKNSVLREAIENITGSGMEKDTVTVVTGPDLVNLVFLNFTCLVADKAQEWTNELFILSTNLLAQNASRKTFLLKAYTKLTLQLTAEEKISVKHIYKMFPADKKRVETALSNCGAGLPCGRNDSIPLTNFSPEVFLTFIHNLCPRTDTDSIFAECGAKNKPYMTVEQFMGFTNNKQRDPRLNEVLFPPLKPHQVQQLIEKYEPNSASVGRGQLSVTGFLHFLNGEENGIVPPEKLDLYEDMTQPLSHYFINSSHNTYLTAGQLKGNSSVEMYRQALLAGCRCVELDCWKGRMAEEEPIITHGFTMTTEIPFKDVIDAIAESAFKTSPYPMILSFENHVDSPKQQAKMAEYCRQAFGDKLLIDPLDRYPLEPGIPLPNPEELKFRILVKNKKKSINKNDSKKRLEEVPSNTPSDCSTGETQSCSDIAESTLSPDNSMNGPDRSKAMDWQKSSAFKKSIVDDLDAGSDDDDYTEEEMKKVTSDEGTASKEVGASEEMSNLVNYIQPMKFNSFEESRKSNVSFLMSSFVETKGLEQLTKSPVEFVEYNKTQLSRIYPKGTRVDSSNYMPQVFWNAGCQMVALNYQSLDLPMQLNMGIFEYNCKCGYLLKPEFMRRPDKHFDPFTCNTIDGIIANTFSVKVISGQFLSDKKVGTFVEVEMYGLPVDTKRKMYKTRTSKENNSINPVWDEEPFVFKKVVLPGLASLRIAVFEEGGKFIGHRILPVSAVRPGFHHICLRNESNQPLMLPSVFVFIEVKDYVPDAYEDIIQGLSNPIKYQSEMEERARQLEALTMEEDDARIGNAMPEAVVSQPKTPVPQSHVKTNSFESPQGNGRPQDQRKMSRCSLPTYDGPCPMDMTYPRWDSVAEVMQDVEPLTLEILRRNKSLVKLLRRQDKELQEIRKKHNKRGEEVQRTMDTFKKKQAFKNRRTSNIELEKSRQLSELREGQENDLLVMRQDQLQVERKKRELHQTQLCAKYLEISQEMHVGRMKKMKDVCEKEQKDLKKQMNAAVKEQLDSVSKELKDKVQVERQKEQINARFISDAVGKYKALEESQIKRQEMLDQRFQQLQQQIRLDSKRQMQELQEQYEAFKEDLPKLVMNFMQQDVRGSICEALGLFPPSLESSMSFSDVDEDSISSTQL